ncbi:extracellular elastinolytic metallo proteinase [Pholiota molesta]|nr:extracellular elastinolytic metallo proteinase [Pholiota molesta]
MRYFFTASLVVASLAGHIYGHRQVAPSPHDEGRVSSQRKSLGFGPEHPHAVFRSSPYQIKTNGFTPLDASMDPLEVARIFVDDVLMNQVSSSSSYKIRKDSYTDKNTGVTHVYVRQLVNGLEVADGDMNINVKDGMVISYGNSFYNGAIPEPYSNPTVNAARNPLQKSCEQLFQTLRSSQSSNVVDSEQVIMGQAPASDNSALLEHIAASTCALIPLPEEHASDDLVDFRPALLTFMANATPNSEVANDILNNFESHKEAMEITPTHHFAPGESPIEFVVGNVPDAVNPVKAKLAYTQIPNEAGDSTELHLVWKFEVEMQDNWYETAVSASAPHEIISVVDWASDAYAPIPKKPEATVASYNVFKWGVNDPECGNRTIEQENFDALASPVGWHAIPYNNDPSFKGVRLSTKDFYRNTTTTWGNNVFAQENWEGQNQFMKNYRPDAGSSKQFDFTYDPQETEKPEAMDEAQKYINTTISQLFYTTNLVHDLYYRYGFDEVSGNFQQYNFGRGGAENDAVIANAQDGSGFNNANFMTPPDGQNGRMRMYLWNTALPYRDGDLEAGIVIHELSHGLSTRLTGGPANSGCLGWGESGGMGEGWGDFLATTIRSNKNYSDYAMGAWAANRDNGIRNYVYSLDEEINPSTYKTLDKPGYWVCTLSEKSGLRSSGSSRRSSSRSTATPTSSSPQPLEDGTVPAGNFYRSDKKGPLVPKHGNSLIVQLVLNGMKLQVCRPSFFDARDAIIQADQGFAARGLGVDATVINRTPWGYTVPSACEEA